jgi:phosphatidate phosphatase APP1
MKQIWQIILIGCFFMTTAYAYGEYTSPIEKEDTVIFFPTLGYPVAKGALWELHVHGWIYNPQWGTSWHNQLRGWFNLGPEEEEKEETDAENKERSHAFFVDNLPDKQIAVHFGKKEFVLDTSTPDGHFSGLLHLPAAEVESLRKGNVIHFEAVTRPEDSRHFGGDIYLVNEQGVSVISDIDDTVKISEVTDKTAFFANTFLRPFQAVPKMNELYTAWSKPGDVTFHYVSSSPWQLYVPLTELLSNSGFPGGTFHLRLFRWNGSFVQSSRPHKIDNISFLIDHSRERHFILVGDSGERDPEVYGTIARKYPQFVIKILIRNVTQEEAEGTRFQEAFKDLPKTLWMVFSDPATVDTEWSKWLPK